MELHTEEGQYQINKPTKPYIIPLQVLNIARKVDDNATFTIGFLPKQHLMVLPLLKRKYT